MAKHYESPERKQKKREYRESRKEHYQQYTKDYYYSHKEEIKQRRFNQMRKDRNNCLSHYGGKCECCGETQYEFLVIDHTEGGGNKHRKEINLINIVSWLKTNGYPEGFRVLCHNCNMALGIYGYCPHKKQAGLM